MQTVWTPFYRRLTLTLAIVVLYRLGILIPVPLIDPAALSELFSRYQPFHRDASNRVSIFALGLMPYVSASVLVEILALFVPALKRYRRGSLQGRWKLKRISLSLTLALAAAQAWGVVDGLQKLVDGGGRKLLVIGGPTDYAALMAILVAGVYVLIGMAELISRRGVGHGISIIVLSGICGGVLTRLDIHARFIRFNGISLYVGVLLIWIGMTALTICLLQTRRSIPLHHGGVDGVAAGLPLNGCPASIQPIGYAATLLMLPATLTAYFEWNSGVWLWDFHPGTPVYSVVWIILITGISFMFAVVFLHPQRRIRRLREMGWIVGDHERLRKALMRRVLIYNLPWTIWLGLLAVIPSILISAWNVPFYVGGTQVFLIVAVGLDLIDRYRFHRHIGDSRVVKTAEFHDVYDAAMVRQHLNREGIPCHMQGYSHRHLLYFFGPYIEIGLWVRKTDAVSVRETLRTCYGGLGV